MSGRHSGFWIDKNPGAPTVFLFALLQAGFEAPQKLLSHSLFLILGEENPREVAAPGTGSSGLPTIRPEHPFGSHNRVSGPGTRALVQAVAICDKLAANRLGKF
jgi:hypothetical protein